MNGKTTKQVYKVDLTKAERSGAFPCPKCGSEIKPDDMTTYRLDESGTKTLRDEVKEMAVDCAKCGSPIKLTGFIHQQKYQEEIV